MSENMSTAIKIGATVLMVVILITIGFFIFGKGKGFVDTASSELDNTKQQVENYKINQYVGANRTGDEVINAVHMLGETGQLNIIVTTGAGSTVTYTATNFYNVSNPTALAYINPTGHFTSTVQRNGSGVATSITFVQN